MKFQVLMAASMKFRVLWDVLLCSQVDVDRLIALMMQAVRTSETSVNINLTTGQYIPEDNSYLNKRGGCGVTYARKL
jgi:hypothetical protein